MILKHILPMIVIALTSACAFKQTINTKETTDPKKQIQVTKKITVGLGEKYEKVPDLKLSEIYEKQFLAEEQKPYLKLPKIEQNTDVFYLQIASQKITFNKYKNHGEDKSWSGFEFLGFYPKLNFYAIVEKFESDNLGFGELILIDKNNGNRFHIESIGDGDVDALLPSPKNKYAVFFYNDIYEENVSNIRVLKINSKQKPTSYFTEYAKYDSRNFTIEKIVWENDDTFLIKTVTKNKSNLIDKQFKYFKVNL